MDIVVYLDSIMFRKATPDYNRVPTFNPDKHNMEVFNRSEEAVQPRHFPKRYTDISKGKATIRLFL